jgi:rhodanese-related sulfurtransferase
LPTIAVSVITESMAATISVQELSDLLSTRDFDVVDVRDREEWAAGHLPGARPLTLEELRADPDTALPRRDGIVFVCARGVRSLTAAKLAARLGYTTIYSLEGGTSAWAQAGRPLVSEQRAAA